MFTIERRSVPVYWDKRQHRQRKDDASIPLDPPQGILVFSKFITSQFVFNFHFLGRLY